MAFAGDLWFVHITFVDAGLNTTRKRVQLIATTDAEAAASAASVVSRFVALTTAYIVGYTVEHELLNDAAGYPPVVGEISDRLLLTVGLTDVPKKASLEVPSPVAAAFGAAGTEAFNIALSSYAATLALINDFNAGQSAYLSDGENTLNTSAGGFVAGRRIHRASTNG